MSRSRSLALIVTAALTAALAPAALASAAAPASADRADQARAEHERIVAYWTPERMKAAKPRDFVRQKDGSFTLAPMPKAKPVGGAKTTSVKGASWTKGGDVLKRTGKVYFTMSGVGYVCSGSVANDGSTAGVNSIVLTAGHCVYDESKTDNAGWAGNWLFIPDFDTKPNLVPTNCASADTTYGCWTALSLVAHSRFTTAGGFTAGATQHDFAFAVVGPGGNKNSALDDRVGAYDVATSGVSAGNTLSAFGYPAAGKYSSGNDLTYCSGPITTDSLNSNLTWGLACDMTGGSSGGPWLKAIDVTSATATAGAGSGGTLSSLNSYGYSGRSFMYGPKFNAETKKVLDQAIANSASGSTTDVAVP